MDTQISDHRYFQIVENMHDAYAYHKTIMDPSGKPIDYEFLEVNQAFCTMTGLQNGEIIGKRVTELLPDITADDFDWIGTYAQVASSGESIQFHRYVPFLRKRYWISAYSYEKDHFICVFRDATEWVDTREKLRQSEEKLKRIFNASPDAVTLSDLNGIITDCSQKALDIHGYSSKDELIGKSAFTLIAPEDHIRAYQNMLTVHHQGLIENIEYIMVKKDGSRFFGELSASVLLDVNQKPEGYIAISKDVSARKEMEDELKKEKNLLQSLIDSIPDYIFFKDTNSLYLGSNRAFAEELTPVKSKEIPEKSDYDLFPRELADFFIQKDQEMLMEGKPKKNEEWVTLNNGPKILLETLKTPYYDNMGNIMGIVGVGRDITERKKAEELNRILHETLEYEKLRSEFFANISHELRTPLNVLLGALQLFELLWKDPISKDASARKYIQIMKQNCYRLVRLIANLIDITKIDSGYFQVELHRHNIAKIILDICLSVNDYIEKKGITFRFESQVEDLYILCDPDKVERIVLNLLSNAIKFSNFGDCITVSLSQEGEKLLLSVKDTGIGIPADKLEVIFERFRQVNKTLTRSHEGSGIGLSLVKSLVEMHDGSISVKSIEGQGSEFVVVLPIRSGEEPPVSEAYSSISDNRIERIKVEFSDIYA